MKAKEIRLKSTEEINTLLRDSLEQQFKLRLAKSSGNLNQHHLIKLNRHLIARLETITAERLCAKEGK